MQLNYFETDVKAMKQVTNNTYGVLMNGVHVDVSKTEKGAKQYATRNGYSTVTVRYNCGYIAVKIARKHNGKWQDITDK